MLPAPPLESVRAWGNGAMGKGKSHMRTNDLFVAILMLAGSLACIQTMASVFETMARHA
jgi:hypothetical protein